MENFLSIISQLGSEITTLFLFIFANAVGGVIVAYLFLKGIKAYIHRSKTVMPSSLARRLHKAVYYFFPFLFMVIAIEPVAEHWEVLSKFKQWIQVGFYISFSFILIRLVFVLSDTIEDIYKIGEEDNLYVRKIQTQLQYIRRVLILVIAVMAISAIFLTFDSVKKLGIGLLSSAGVVGVVLGIAAQKSIGNLLAGLQIAFTQPMRLDDVVIVENEWGKIEEITLTYVVVRIWDKRRLVLPLNYFIEKPFQNWTRKSADIIGTVYLYADYTLPIAPLREHLTNVLEGSPLWDKEVNVIQVTNTTDKVMELRALVSAKNSPAAWDLRCLVREELVTFIQKNYPESLPKSRVIGVEDMNRGGIEG